MKRSKGIQNFKLFVSNMGRNTDLDAENLKNNENTNYQRIFKEVPPESLTINGGTNDNDGNSAPVIKSILYKDSYINTSNENIKSSPLALKMKSALVNAERKLSPRSYDSSNYESDDSMTLTSSIKSSKSSRRKHHVTFNETDEIKTYLSDSMSSLDSGASFSEPEPASVEHVVVKDAFVRQTPVRVSFNKSANNNSSNSSTPTSTPISTPGSTPPSVLSDSSPIPVPGPQFIVVETEENYALERTDSWEELQKYQNLLHVKENISSESQSDSADGGKIVAPKFNFKPKPSHAMGKLVQDINKPPPPPKPKPFIRNFAPKAKEKPPEVKQSHIPLQNQVSSLKWEKSRDGDKIQYNSKPKVVAPLPRKRTISIDELSKQTLNTKSTKDSSKPSIPICEVVLKEDIAKVRSRNLHGRPKNKYLVSPRSRKSNNVGGDSIVPKDLDNSDTESVVSTRSMSSKSSMRSLSRSSSWEELMIDQSSDIPEDDSLSSSLEEETNVINTQETEKDNEIGPLVENNDIEYTVSSLLKHKPQATESQVIKSNRTFSQTLHNENVSMSGPHNSIAKESWSELQKKKEKERENFFHQAQKLKNDPRDRLKINLNTSEPKLNSLWKVDKYENKNTLATMQPPRSRATSLERHLKRVEIPKLNPFEPPSLSYDKKSIYLVNPPTKPLSNETSLINKPVLNNTQKCEFVPDNKMNHTAEDHLNHNNSNNVQKSPQILSKTISNNTSQDNNTEKKLVTQQIHSNKINGEVDNRAIGQNNQILEKEILISDFERNHKFLLENLEKVESEISEIENHYENHVPLYSKPELQTDLSVRPKTKVNQNNKHNRPTTLECVPISGLQNSTIYSDTHDLQLVNGKIQNPSDIFNGIKGSILQSHQNTQVVNSKYSSANGTHMTNGKTNTIDALPLDNVKYKSANGVLNGSHSSEQSISVAIGQRSVTPHVTGKMVRMLVADMDLGSGQPVATMAPTGTTRSSSSPTPSDASSSGWSDQSLGSHSSGCFSGAPSPTPSLASTTTPCDLRVTPSPTSLTSPTAKTFPQHPPKPPLMNGNAGLQQMSRIRASAKPTAL
ncbi:unnamed protein product [Meganyctiphanes norvegica]|uniref:Uncharacterized protein n=1 Tax=Meganyctiphanes norvegica TaxID=48144 RepID=A0AAV2QQF9_MEGNR